MKARPIFSLTSDLPPGYRIEAVPQPAQRGDELLSITSRLRVTLFHHDIDLIELQVENRRFEARTQAAVHKLRTQAWTWHDMGPGVPALWEAWHDAKGCEKLSA